MILEQRNGAFRYVQVLSLNPQQFVCTSRYIGPNPALWICRNTAITDAEEPSRNWLRTEADEANLPTDRNDSVLPILPAARSDSESGEPGGPQHVQPAEAQATTLPSPFGRQGSDAAAPHETKEPITVCQQAASSSSVEAGQAQWRRRMPRGPDRGPVNDNQI